MKKLCCLLIMTVTVLAISSSAFGAVLGDLDGSGEADMEDTIYALMIMCNIDTPTAVDDQLAVNLADVDVDGDLKIGIQEAIFALEVGTGHRDKDGFATSCTLFGSGLLMVVGFRLRRIRKAEKKD